MNRFIAALFIALSVSAKSQAVELTIDPSFKYSTKYGFDLIVDTAVDFLVNENWQFGFGGKISTQNKHSNYEFYLGPTYNFSRQTERSLFLSFGMGYSNHYTDRNYHNLDPAPASGFGFMDFGKRFLLSEKYTITYKPTIGATFSHGQMHLQGSILSFSCFF